MSRSHKGHYGTWHTALWSRIYELSVHEQFCWMYLNYLTLRSNVKVPRRSLRYATHCLMVMHPHTNYRWPTSRDKNVMVRTRKYYLKYNYLTLSSPPCHFLMRKSLFCPAHHPCHFVMRKSLFLRQCLLYLSQARIKLDNICYISLRHVST